MKLLRPISALVTALTVLLGCGGGGGGGSSSSNNTTNTNAGLALNFTPSSIEENLQEGTSINWSITARVSGTVNEDVHVRVVDSYGIISSNESDFFLETINSTTYRLNVKSNPTLSAGEHSSNIEVQLCKNQACSSQFDGSPWRIPVSVNVASQTNLSPLNPIANFSGWTTGNVWLNNSRYVPVTLDINNFSSRWLRSEEGAQNRKISQLVAQNNVLMFIESIDTYSDLDTRNVIAINEVSGEELWQQALDQEETIVQTLISDNKVNVITNYASYSRFSLDAGIQELNQSLPQDSLLSTSTATMFDGKLYLGGVYDYHNRIMAYDPDTDMVEWSVNNNSYNYGEESTVVADENHVYYYDSGRGLIKIDRTTGIELEVITDPNASNSKDYGTALLANDKVVTFTPISLSSSIELAVYDVVNHTLLWAEEADYLFSPVIKGNEVIVAINGESAGNTLLLESRNINTGSLNWQTSIPTTSYDKYNMIVTDNLIFIGLEYMTIAYDIASDEVTWEYPRGGELIMSNHGVLYIHKPSLEDGVINAINLQ